MNKIAFRTIYLERNCGLGNALRLALQNSTFSLVARMDSDDISYPNRFQKQLEEFKAQPELDIVGGGITEFVGSEQNIIGQRVVKQTDFDIKMDMKKRCPMNHVTVMYKKKSVQDAGGYLDWPWNEDYYLWIRMMENGCHFANIQENLVNVRVGLNMSARRGGWKYFSSEKNIQKYMLNHKIITPIRFLYNVILRFGGEVLAPNSLREKLFKLYRKKYSGLERKKDTEKLLNEERYPDFSVALSVYGKDNAEWFDQALKSVIIDQTVKPSEIVLVVDGPIPGSIQSIIDKYTTICCGLYT